MGVRPDFDFHSGEPVYLQIVDHFRRQVALRELRPGMRLPAIRSLARELNLDPGTVARAYRELEREGVIVSRRGSGSFVTPGGGKEHIAEERQKRLGLVVERAILEALGLGLTAEDIETAFTLRLADWRERGTQSARRRRVGGSKQKNEIRFAGSHDLTIELLTTHMRTLYPDLHFAATFVGSLAGLVALECRQADIAGAHLLDQDSGRFNVPFVKRLMPNETVILMNLVQRVQGLMLAPKNPKHILGIEDLTRPDITFVNRQSGSGTRILFDSRLLNLGMAPAKIRGYEHEEKTHTAVASLIGQRRADVGLGAQSAANAFGLDFIPLLKERYDLIALKEVFERPSLCKLQEAVCSDSFRHMLSSMPGYDVTDTGKTVTISP